MLEVFTKLSATLLSPTGSYSTATGTWTAGTPSTSTVAIIAPQPASGRDLQFLPEGEREYIHLKTWTEASVLTGDKITVAGRTYRVTTTKPWFDDGNFVQVLMREDK